MLRRSARLARNDCKSEPHVANQPKVVAEKTSRKRKTLNSVENVKKEHTTLEKDYKTPTEKVTSVKESESDILISQNFADSMFIGCHTSIAGGLWKAPQEAAQFGAKAFGLFLHSQQQWNMKPLIDEHAKRFMDTCKKLGYQPNQIVPHGSYLMNCGSPRPDVKEKSDAMLVEELKRCEKLGLVFFNFHPGSTLGKVSIDECLTAIADAINKAHRATKYVIVLLENMSCQGNTVGGKFKELKSIINKVDDKSRIGVCIDTCHSHAAGYDLSTSEGYDAFTGDLESIIGWEYVKAFHLNDSKGPSGCRKDRHENIGKGTIGLEGFRRIMNDPRLAKIPMILETPYGNDDIYKKEIKLLYSLIK